MVLDRLLFSQISSRLMLRHFLPGILAKDPGKAFKEVMSVYGVTRGRDATVVCFQRLFLKKVPNFHLQLLADTLKKGTKFRLLFGGGEIQITHVISLKRSKNVPFSTERVFLSNNEKRHHYLVSYQ